MAQILLAILGITLVVIIHEAGHFLVARAFGIRVTHFSIGFGPALFRYRPRNSPTTFQLCVIPFLAYVKMAGNADPTAPPDPKDDGLFENKSVFARGLTLLGGPVANYLAASFVVFVLATTGWREDEPSKPVTVARVEGGSAADAAGIRPGDVLESVEGTRIGDVGDLVASLRSRSGQPTIFSIRRGDDPVTPFVVVPREADGRVVIGITPARTTTTRALPVSEAASLAVIFPWKVSVANVGGLVDLARRRTTEGVVGPVGMVKGVAREAGGGPWAFAMTLAMVSIALGFFNLLPLPFLDGGRLVFVAVEGVSRRRPNRTVEALVHAVGLLLLLGMTALVTLRDVAS